MIKGTIDASHLQPKLDLSKDTDAQLKAMLQRAEATPHKDWTYQHFLMASRVHLEILRREGTINRLYENASHLHRT
jgi:hypothetical protein